MHANMDKLWTGLFVAAFLWLLALSGTTFAATRVSHDPGGSTAHPAEIPAGPPPAHADRDGDGLSDALQAKLAKAQPNDLVDVVVLYSGPGNAENARQAIGPFKLKDEFQIIPGFAGTMTAAQARGLAKAKGVFRVEEDFQVTTTLDAANRDFGTAAARTTYAVTGSGVGICVIDTGIDPGHEQLSGKVAGFIDYINGLPGAYDDHGHGTHVSAIAAGSGGTPGSDAERFKGVAPGASLYGVKALSSTGTGSESDIIAGIQWCADDIARNATGPGVHVISMSFSSTQASDGQDAMSQAVNAVVTAGKVVVAAVGNSGAGQETVGSPAAADLAITVGAVAEWSADPTAANHSKGIYLAPFSSRGPTLAGGIKPDILAPGVSVTAARANTSSGYVTFSGTSMATPFVSGTVALALESPASLMPPVQIKGLLMATAQDRGPTGADNDWGAGLIDGYRFVAEARGEPFADPTPFPAYQRAEETIPINGTVEFPFEITASDLGVPIAATLTIMNGEYVCLYGSVLFCDLFGGWIWTPDIDVELIHPNGSIVASSECPLYGDCGQVGRQETLYYLPTAATDTGTYRLRMYQFSTDPGGAQAGDVAIDLSTGPVLTGLPSPNSAPTISTNAPPTATEDVLYSYNAEVSDPNGPAEIWGVLAGDTCGGTIDNSGIYTFTPAGPAPPSSCVLNIQVCDGGSPSLCDAELATITISAVNDRPIANNDGGAGFSTSAETPFTTGDVLANDSDPEGDLLTIINYASASAYGGSVSYNNNGTFDYTPPVGFSGTDSFTYYANDGALDSSNPALVTINVTAAIPSLHIGDLDGSSSVRKRNWTATVTVTVHDATHEPVEGATVSGFWSGGNPGSCTTVRKGQCKLSLSKIDLATNSIDFAVETVNGADTSTVNHDLEGDSNGTLITVNQ